VGLESGSSNVENLKDDRQAVTTIAIAACTEDTDVLIRVVYLAASMTLTAACYYLRIGNWQ